MAGKARWMRQHYEMKNARANVQANFFKTPYRINGELKMENEE
jgi:hypothetical protein